MGRCCVRECKAKGSKGFHAFPANRVTKHKWIQYTKTFHLTENELKYSKVCDSHFKITDRIIDADGKNCLLPNAVPCLLRPPGLKSEHDYSTGSTVLKCRREPPKKKSVASSEIIPSNDPILINVGNEMEIDEVKNEVALDPLTMLQEATYRIKVLEEKLKKSQKEKAALAAKNRINLRKLKRSELKGQKLDVDKILKYFKDDANFNEQQMEFLIMQLSNSKKKLHGERYTDEQKNFSLAIYKQSPKCYRFLRRIFRLPSKRTLGRHSAKIIFESGIDPKLFDFIKERVNNMPEIDKYCTISFDEMALKAHLDYNEARDLIEGFVELADERRPEFATHSLTFMVRGIHTPYKQSVAFFYTAGLKSVELATLIKLVTEAVLETGLNVIGSTCDQAGTNVAAIHILVYGDYVSRTPNGQLLLYKIKGNSIIHCYDPPHLIKVLRNNLQTKNLKHFVSERWNSPILNNNDEEKAKFASWSHVSDLYDLDCQGNYRRLRKITPEHIKPNKLKMKVSVATQVFSKTYGTFMMECCEQEQLPTNYSDTAQILLFFNDLYDSINGSNEPENDTLKGSVNEDSDHFQYWEYALKMLSKMNFIDKETNEVNNASTVLKKFESTIRGYIEIASKCLNLKMDDVPIRNMNQDGLENIFGVVKTNCQNAKKLIPMQFRTGYATMTINNITCSNSLSTNCEPDSSVPLLSNVHELFLNFKQENENINCDQNDIDSDRHAINSDKGCDQNDMFEAIIFDPQFSESELKFTEKYALSHVSNLIYNKVLKVTVCEDCRNNLQSNSVDNDDQNLPSPEFIQNFEILFCKLNEMIPHVCSEKSLKKTLISHIEDMNIGCAKHHKEVSLNMKKISISYALFSFCNDINSILSKKTTTQTANSNKIQDQAFTFVRKKKQIGKFSDIFTV